jgi:cytochrome c oxidase subunit 2
MPGRENEAWFRVERPGIYRGQCNQLCGLNHAFMPIEVEAISKDAFERWLVQAKKRFAAAGTSLEVAAARGSAGVAHPTAAGN